MEEIVCRVTQGCCWRLSVYIKASKQSNLFETSGCELFHAHVSVSAFYLRILNLHFAFFVLLNASRVEILLAKQRHVHETNHFVSIQLSGSGDPREHHEMEAEIRPPTKYHVF